MDVEDEVRKFVVRDLGWAGDASLLTVEYPLLENDVIDSMGIFQMVSMIEERLGVVIDDEEITADNFGTIGAVAGLVRRNQAG